MAEPTELLRRHGLRVTPQRRTILEVFSGAADEHLSADEVHARARRALPEIGRGTVYATLGELADCGLLASQGSPDPVRYETNLEPHGHFRCRLCLRLFDVAPIRAAAGSLAGEGFEVDSLAVVAEGVCAECNRFEEGVDAGVALLHSRRRIDRALLETLACRRLETPLGTLALGGCEDGVARIAFPEHADYDALVARAGSRRGAKAARRRVDAAAGALAGYFDGSPAEEDAIAPLTEAGERDVLDAARRIGFGDSVSYERLEADADPYARGHALGSNPLPILVPCHRVRRGRGLAGAFVGGLERREVLLALESAA